MPAFTNQALLTYNNNRTALSNIANGNIADPFVITKRASITTTSSNDDVTYVITITNSSAAPLINLTMTDNLGAYPYGAPPVILYPLTL